MMLENKVEAGIRRNLGAMPTEFKQTSTSLKVYTLLDLVAAWPSLF